MLSYQHIYHAGGWGDIHKHAVLCAVWQALQRQHDKLQYFETHAGRGVYDLRAKEAQKTSEYKTGVARVDFRKFPVALSGLAQALNFWQPLYPGSPGCVAAFARPTDRMTLCELHPLEFHFLKDGLHQQKRISFYQKDGHQFVPGLMKLAGQGLVLIDPSYEIKDEYAQISQTVKNILAQNAGVSILIWYPVLYGKNHQDVLLNGLRHVATGKEHVLSAPQKVERGMVQSGLYLINPPAMDWDGITQAVENLLAV